ncbi:hypothetical protein MXB_3369 [Myxobolus squamalis]|nr:hypothetical protein MXB_3369 [Myxobolus squamalis]
MIGYVIVSNKQKTLNTKNLNKTIFEGYEFLMIPIDPSIPVKQQEKIDILIHKAHQYFIQELKISENSKLLAALESFELDMRINNIPIIDSCATISTILDRVQIANILHQCQFQMNGIKVQSPQTLQVEFGMTDPEFLNLMEQNNLKFPIMTKPLGGYFPKFRYEMSLHFNHSVKGFDKITDQFSQYIPCIIQQFYNHGGVVYKLYIIGDEWYICARPSIINLDQENHEPVFFKSCAVTRKCGICSISSSIEDSNIPTSQTCGLDRKVICKLVASLRSKIGLNLVGIDIIVDSTKSTYYVVDVNYFPGYNDVPDLNSKFIKLFYQYALKHNL